MAEDYTTSFSPIRPSCGHYGYDTSACTRCEWLAKPLGEREALISEFIQKWTAWCHLGPFDMPKKASMGWDGPLP